MDRRLKVHVDQGAASAMNQPVHIYAIDDTRRYITREKDSEREIEMYV